MALERLLPLAALQAYDLIPLYRLVDRHCGLEDRLAAFQFAEGLMKAED